METCLSLTWLFHFWENVLWKKGTAYQLQTTAQLSNIVDRASWFNTALLPQGLDTITEGKINYKVYQDFLFFSFFVFMENVRKVFKV